MDATLLAMAREGIMSFLEREEAEFRAANPEGIPQSAADYFEKARANVIPNIQAWMDDPHADSFSANIKGGIEDAIRAERWADLVDAFIQEISFGTAGIRGRMALDRESILKMKADGPSARILKGPATLNDKVLLLKSVGVARFANDRGMAKIVIGYDSRVCGRQFAELNARLFLAHGLTVYLFDEPCPYPELTFAVPNLRADIGILFSASHNDFRYNGYKVSCGNGSQFSLEDRKVIVRDYISHATTADIKLLPFEEAGPDQLWFLGGSEPAPGAEYHGREDKLIDMHTRHIDHMKHFIMRPGLLAAQKDESHPLNIGYCAFHGAGRKAVPRLLRENGFVNIHPIHKLDEPDGMFPCFRSDPGFEQQPDPGDYRAAAIALDAYREQYGSLEGMDVLLGTDPDADRCSAITEVPANQRHLYGGDTHALIPSDDLWALILWYRLNYEIETHGAVRHPEEKFITLSHTTSDALTKLALKHGLGVMKSWVGFAMLAMCVNEVWQGNPIPAQTEGRVDPAKPDCHPFMYATWDMQTGKRRFNMANMEQSAGFSILGGPPKDAVSLGEGGHVRDKDGVFASLLLAEIAAYGKKQGKTLYELIDEHVFLDPDVGLFINYYEPDPLDGEYDGLQGFVKKREVIRKMLALRERCERETVTLAGMAVKSTAIYWTGKYDAANFAGFPDEGVRFYFDDDRWNYLTFRPSGTSNALRFHLQLHRPGVTRENLVAAKGELRDLAKNAVAELRSLVGAVA